MTNILLVEDSRISRAAIEDKIKESEKYHLEKEIADAANAELLCMKCNIDLVLMDVCTAHNESGLDAAEKIKKNFPEIKVIIMTSMPEHSFLQRARDCGCDGFWYKEIDEYDVLDVCDRVVNGEKVWPDSSPVIMIGNARSDEFTDREFEVLRALTQGYKYKDIAKKLFISNNTLKYHIGNLLQKTGYESTLQLVVEVVDKKLILPKY